MERGSFYHSTGVVSLHHSACAVYKTHPSPISPPNHDIQTDFCFCEQGDLRSAARVPSMCILHHTPHKPSSRITYSKLSHNVEPNVKRLPRALLQRLMPQMLRKDSSTALPRVEPCKRATPSIHEETCADGTSCIRAMYGSAAPHTLTEAGTLAGQHQQSR